MGDTVTIPEEEADELAEEIEKFVAARTGFSPDQYQYDPSGELCVHALVADGWIAPIAGDALLIRTWELLTGEKLRRQSDEPESYDDALGAQCDAKAREEEARRLK